MVPGYGDHRWNMDILKLLEAKGGLLREAPDSLITEISGEDEEVKFAIEFCGALPAGNQAWQRNGRALSFAYSKIPYFYITELGGYELDGDRDRKAERTPNPLVPFSYIAISLEMDTAVLPIYVPSPGTSPETQLKYQNTFGLEDLKRYIHNSILNKETSEITQEIARKTIKLVRLIADSKSKSDSLTGSEWMNLYEEAQGDIGFLGKSIEKKYTKKWSKKTSLDSLTETFKELLNQAKNHTVGVTSTNLPMSMIKEDDRLFFGSLVKKIYPNSSQEFINFVNRKNGPLSIAWIAGFKPKGDDARPDRGLSPLLRMSVGSKCDVIAVVYGPAPKAAVELLKTNQEELGKKNGLWESIIQTADGIIVDCKHEGLDQSTLLLTDRTKSSKKLIDHSYTKKLKVLKFGEQDVDTGIHCIFTRLFPIETFEGLCNPPGGDWSGISLKNKVDGDEFRWLTLPRVTATDQKRPDHIFQLFTEEKNYIIICESKDSIKQIEDEIGPRLIKYVKELSNSVPDIERSPTGGWSHSKRKFDVDKFEFVTIAAGILSATTSLSEIGSRGNVDLVIGFQFNSAEDVAIKIYSKNSKGQKLENYLKQISNTEGLMITT